MCTSVYLSFSSSMDTCVASSSWLLWRSCCTPGCTLVSSGPCFQSAGTHSEVEQLKHMITLFLIFEDCHTIFHGSCSILHSQQQSTRGKKIVQEFQFLPILTNTSVFQLEFSKIRSHSGRCLVIPHCGFDMQFSNDF